MSWNIDALHPPFRIHPATWPGHVHLNVADLERQISFYQQAIGLQLHWRQGDTAGLGAGGDDLLRLTRMPNGRRYDGTSGLYHFAILLPQRRCLAQVIARLLALRIRNYPTDHIMTKSTYLEDTEGNGIEIYVESPEDGVFAMQDGVFFARRADGSLSNGREPLDLEALFTSLDPDESLEDPLPIETKIGHIHLHVADLDESMHFYHDLLGFDAMGMAHRFRMGMVSAGGYHHHIGFNIWEGEGAPPPPPNALGLRYFTMMLPDLPAWEQVQERVKQTGLVHSLLPEGLLLQDPSSNKMLMTVRKETNP